MEALHSALQVVQVASKLQVTVILAACAALPPELDRKRGSNGRFKEATGYRMQCNAMQCKAL